MAKSAGYGVLVQATQKSLQLALGVYHGAGIFPVSFTDTTTIGSPSGLIPIAYDLFADVPRLTLSGATPTRVGVEVWLSGRVTATTAALAFDRAILIRVGLSAGVFAVPAIAETSVRFAAQDLTVTNIEVDPIEGGALPAGLVALVTSPAAIGWLNGILTGFLSSIPTITPPIALPLLGEIENVAIAGTTIRVLDGAIALGIDLANPSITGTASDITNQLGKSGMSVIVHPSLVPAVANTAKTRIGTELVQHGASISSLTIAIEGDCFRVNGKIGKDGATANFSLLLKPRLGKEDVYGSYDEEYGATYTYLIAEGHDDVWVEVVHSEFDIDLPWYLYLAGTVLLGPLAPAGLLFIADLIASVSAQANGLVVKEIGDQQIKRVQQITLPGTSGPLVSFTITMTTVDAHGPRVRSSLSVGGVSAGTLNGPLWIDSSELATNQLAYAFTIGSHLYHLLDPLVRFVWQVRRFDTMAVVHTVDLPASHPHWSAISLNEVIKAQKTDKLVITCTALRRFGAVQEKIASDSCTLVISDRLNRAHPYVHWRHRVYSPIGEMQPNGQLKVLDYYAENRKSAIHRTDVPGRCLHASRYSEDAQPQYLDSLPFAIEDIDFHRDLLCDYCFWGGPDKTELKSLPAQG